MLGLIGEKDALIEETAKELKVGNVADLAKRAAQLQSELKAAKSEIEALEAKMAGSRLDEIVKNATTVKGATVIAARADGLAPDAVRSLCDTIRDKDAKAVIVIASVVEGKLNFVCACGKEALTMGANAGKIIKEIAMICGGGGGGRPDSATAGGKDLSKIGEAIAAVPATVEKYLK